MRPVPEKFKEHEALYRRVHDLVDEAQNAVWNGWDETDRVGDVVSSKLMEMIIAARVVGAKAAVENIIDLAGEMP